MQEHILIIPNNIKNKIIEKVRKEYYNYNIKFISLEDFIKKYTFNYDNKTIYNLIKKYNINLSSALVYLNNLYYISDKLDNKKMKLLKEIKEYLDNNNLLIYDYRFRNYVKDKKIYIHGYDYINKYYQSILKGLDYTVVDYKHKNNKIDNIYEFNNTKEEVLYLADSISNLIKNNIDIKKIKLIISNEYNEEIYRIFKIYNIPISIKKRSIYSTSEVKKVLNNLDDIDNIIDNINNIELKEKIVKVLNNYSFIKDKKEVIELITNDFKNTYFDNNITGIKICNIEDYFEEDDYVFLLGFNKENIPMLHTDSDYFSDKEKEILELDTSNKLNINKKIEVIKRLGNINNLTISYKLNDNTTAYTRSDLLLDVNIIKDNKISYNNSNMMNKILLAEKLDNLVKYNIKDKDLDILYNNYSIPYMKYDNKYTPIEKDKLYKYLNNNLVLSYTSLEHYNECKFKYYIDNILKISVIEDDFKILLGNVCHYVLSHIYEEEFSSDKYFDEYLSSARTLTKKEEYILNNIKEELRSICDIVKKEHSYSTFDKHMTEKSVCVNKDRNIKVTFKGVIDKVMYKEEDNTTYLSIIDYKTGNPTIDLKNMKYGLGLQLPIYLYLSSKMNLSNIEVVGFYLQKLFDRKLDNTKNYEEEREKNLRLEGYSINEENILSKFDTTYNDSKLIKTIKTSNNGFYKTSKVLSREEINNIISDTDKIIDNVIDDILKSDFDINPKIIDGKNVSCGFCKYRDICYLREENKVYINGKEDNDEV